MFFNNALLQSTNPLLHLPYFEFGGIAILLGTVLGIVYLRNRLKTKRLKWEQRLREQEQERIRRRTAEDFHDEIGNKLTRIKLLASVAKTKLDKHPEEVEQLLEQIQENANTLYLGAKDIIWSLQPESDYWGEVLDRIIHNARSIFEPSDIHFEVNLPDNFPKSLKTPGNLSRNLIMVFKEATHNIVKHAHAQKVSLSVVYHPNQMEITVLDDGVGLNQTTNSEGNGLKNMNNRIERIGGKFTIKSKPEKEIGTEIKVMIPL